MTSKTAPASAVSSAVASAIGSDSRVIYTTADGRVIQRPPRLRTEPLDPRILLNPGCPPIGMCCSPEVAASALAHAPATSRLQPMCACCIHSGVSPTAWNRARSISPSPPSGK